MAEFADNGTTKKVCKAYKSADNCTLIIDERNEEIKIATSYCIFNVEGMKVKCEIKTNYGDVNGRIDCSILEE